MHRLLSLLLLAGCSAPAQMSNQRQSSSQESAQAQDQAQSSAHQSAAKQGTNSMPVIIICNTNNSPGARCATQPEDAPIMGEIKSKIKEGARK